MNQTSPIPAGPQMESDLDNCFDITYFGGHLSGHLFRRLGCKKIYYAVMYGEELYVCVVRNDGQIYNGLPNVTANIFCPGECVIVVDPEKLDIGRIIYIT